MSFYCLNISESILGVNKKNVLTNMCMCNKSMIVVIYFLEVFELPSFLYVVPSYLNFDK